MNSRYQQQGNFHLEFLVLSPRGFNSFPVPHDGEFSMTYFMKDLIKYFLFFLSTDIMHTSVDYLHRMCFPRSHLNAAGFRMRSVFLFVFLPCSLITGEMPATSFSPKAMSEAGPLLSWFSQTALIFSWPMLRDDSDRKKKGNFWNSLF